MKTVLHEKLPDDKKDEVTATAEILAKIVEGLGDGAVSLSSTKLDGVEDHVIVRGNHASMLHKKPQAGKKPTALGEVLKRLKTDASSAKVEPDGTDK